jgi:hypothetical protein
MYVQYYGVLQDYTYRFDLLLSSLTIRFYDYLIFCLWNNPKAFYLEFGER